MRSLLVLLLVAFGVSGVATAQTAEFKCPAVGNQYDFKWNSGRITRYTSQGREGTDCAYMVTRVGSGGAPSKIAARSNLLFTPIPPLLAAEVSKIWPLAVGRQIRATVDFAKANPKDYQKTDGTPSSWVQDFQMDIQAYLKINLPYGPLDVFRIEVRTDDKSDDPHFIEFKCRGDLECHGSVRTTTKIWYSPELSIVVKFEETQDKPATNPPATDAFLIAVQ